MGRQAGLGGLCQSHRGHSQHITAVTCCLLTLPGHGGHRATPKALGHSRVRSDPWDPPAAREKGCSSGHWEHLNKRALHSIGLSDMLQTKPAWIWHISQATVTELPSHETVSFFPVSPFSGTSAPFTQFLLSQMPLCLLPTLPDSGASSQVYFKGLAEPTTALSFFKPFFSFSINKPRKPLI